jgi:acyl carrier protein
MSTSVTGDALKAEIKQAIVRCLRLPISAAEIGDDTPLFFEEGLGLDSIDVLELVLELERSFGVAIRDEQTGMTALKSVNTIHDFVLQERAKNPT